MKQIEYTEKQKEILKILKPFEEFYKENKYFNGMDKLGKKIKDTKEKYGIKEQYQTLREYLKKHSCGAYHQFIFEIDKIKIDVLDDHDFERMFNTKLLDKYFVVNDRTEDNGGDCTNYNCKHFLTIEEIDN